VAKKQRDGLVTAKWSLGIISFILIVLGFILFFNPISGLYVSTIIIGIVLLISAIFYLVMFFFNLRSPEAGWILISAILSFIVGWILVISPQLSLSIIIFLVGIWAVALGATHFADSFMLRHCRGCNWGWHMIGGILLVLFGILIIFNPFATYIVSDYFIAIMFILYGIMGVFGAFALADLDAWW